LKNYKKLLFSSLILFFFSLLIYIALQKTNQFNKFINQDAPIELTKEELTWLANNKNLYVSVKPGWAPIAFLSGSGEFRGISIDLLKKIEQLLDVRFNRILAKEDIVQENADIILSTSNLTFIQSSRYTTLNKPYLVSPFAIYSKIGNEFIDLKSLEGKKMAIFRTSNIAKNLAVSHPKINLYAADIVEEGLEAVSSGKADAYVGNSIIVDYSIINLGFRDLKASGISPYKSELYMAVKTNSPLLASSLEKAINHISAKEIQIITDSWTLKLTKKIDVNYKLIFLILALSFSITYFLYNSNKKLNEEIEQRKKIELSLIEERNKLEATEFVIRQYSNDLKTLNETLEEKVKMRTLDLEIEVEERKNAERILIQTQNTLVEKEKLASLGGLVAGVAHEVNTPIGVGVTAISHLREKSLDLIDLYRRNLMKRSNIEEYFEVIVNATKIIEVNLFRASELIRSFKELSVDQSGGDSREINLLSYLQQICMSLQPNFKNRPIDIDLTNINESLVLKIQAGAFSQVISNLILNSLKHAFDDNQPGLIRISAATIKQDLVLVYEDDGKGIPKENLHKVFEPFFTTKRGSGGSGLGLHVAYNIINQTFLGKIELLSEANQGVKFEMLIPNCVLKD
jgi:signal transduction histidine kinase